MSTARHCILGVLLAALCAGLTACEDVTQPGQNDPPEILSIRPSINENDSELELAGQELEIVDGISGEAGSAATYEISVNVNDITFDVFVQVNNINEDFTVEPVLTFLASENNAFGDPEDPPPGGIIASVTQTTLFTQPGSAKGVKRMRCNVTLPESIALGRDRTLPLCSGVDPEYLYRFDVIVTDANGDSDGASANVTFRDNARSITKSGALC